MSQVILGKDAASTTASAARNAALFAYAVTMFLSAVLLFSIQPMFAKIALPLLGGSPGVWNTAMVFFQSVLLMAYGYAHVSTRWLGVRRQALLHAAVLAVAFVALPIAAVMWEPPTDSTPVLWLIGFFAASIGLPVFAVSATAPLLQRWFAGMDHPAAKDPYFLYGASNLGSLLSLVAYPLLFERWLSVDGQGWAWSLGYGALAILIGLCAVLLWRHPAVNSSAVQAQADDAASAPITWKRRSLWVLLAFVPSSLLLGVTTHISTDIAATPLFWVVPLALYLLTFVLVFARRPLLQHSWMVRVQPIVFITLAIMFALLPMMPIWFALGLNLLVFFVAAMVCHGELAGCRPAVSRLTEFYVWMSIGGVLGGMFNALAAPLIFDGVYEYPIALALACLLRPRRSDSRERAFTWLDILIPGVLLVVLLLINGRLDDLGRVGIVAFLVTVALLLLSSAERPLRFALGFTAAIFLATGLDGRAVDQERSFFSVNKVRMHESGNFMVLVHGNTVHGVQPLDTARRDEPRSYYSNEGPLGQLFEVLGRRERFENVGVAGLGIGTLACYRQPGQHWIFYEIDPVVVRMARDTRYFQYLSDCAPDAPVVLGDARLSVAREAAARFDLLILDAFSSDAIPAHLVTREAVALYLDKLADDGVLVFNVTNRYVDLRPILANLAADTGLAAWAQAHRPTEEMVKNQMKFASVWVVMTRRAENLAALDSAPRWSRLEPQAGARLWTDDYSNVLSAIKW
jgi:spermidine synthase